MKNIDEQINYGNPILIVLVYLVFGIIWVLFSDAILAIRCTKFDIYAKYQRNCLYLYDFLGPILFYQ